LSTVALAYAGSSHSKFKFHVNFCCCSKRSEWVQGLVSGFVSCEALMMMSCWHLAQHQSWRNTSCQLSKRHYAIYLQLPSIFWRPFPQSKTWGGAMSWL
jgi:hypothetical protein